MRILIPVISGLLFATAAFGIVLPCTTDTYTNYSASGFSCTDGDATFSNFSPLSFTNSGVANLSTDDIEVIPGGTTLAPTLTFEYVTPGMPPVPTPVTVNTSGEIFSLGLSYQLDLTGATLTSVQMASTFTNTSPGSVSATKNAQLLGGGPIYVSNVGDGGVSNSLATYSGPVTSVSGVGSWIIDDTTSLQAQSGSVTQDSFENLFAETAVVGTNTPEPATMALIGSGLVGVGLLSRRRRIEKP
jgi:hypothetical protein